jgi:hypothetical protein
VAIGCLATVAQGCGDPSADRFAAPAWAVDPVPVVDIAADTPGEGASFGYAEGATRLPTGTLVVADPSGSTVHFFNALGKPVRTVGRGRFQAPVWVQQCAQDSLFVWDYLRARVTVMDTAGRVAREYREPEQTFALACSRRGVVARLALGRFRRPPGARGETTRSAVVLADTRGQVTNHVGLVAFGENRPLGRLASIAVGDGLLYVGTALSPSVDVYRTDGRHAGVLDVGVGVRPPTARNQLRAVERMVAPLRAG